MSPELAERVRTLFAAVLERPADERRTYLAETCRGDDPVYREVESLLAAGAAAGDFLRLDPEEETTDLVVDRRIGPYKLLRKLGSGGMGVVHLAARDAAHFQKRVALKELRPDAAADPSELAQRFRTERRILASLNHPNIARFLDGGITDDGRLYFTMEYVDGMPVDRFVERRRMGLRGRIELFRKICSAVHSAHQKLVIHGDLKPDNILVTTDGTPKLLDFGVAKPLDPEMVAGTVFPTRAGRPWTPNYGSPEQFLGEPLSTASDIYSLGVLLYQLLSGRRPYELKDQSRAEKERLLCVEMPELPSVAALRSNPDIAAAEARRLDRRLLPRSLVGDLDNIVTMALRKEPQRRYTSAKEMSDDLGRYLEGFPIIARPLTFSYRVGKLIQRHRVSAVVTLIVVLSLFTGVGALWVQSRETLRQRNIAEAEKKRYQELVFFLEDLFDTVPNAEQILDRGKHLLEGGSSGPQDPASRAAALETLGALYHGRTLLEDSEETLGSALRTYRIAYGDAHPRISATLCKRAAVRIHGRDLPAAASDLERAFDILRRKAEPGDPLLAGCRILLGHLRFAEGRVEEAAAIYRGMPQIFSLDESPREIAEALRGLARVEAASQRIDNALDYFDEALHIYRKTLGPKHPKVAITLGEIGTALRNAGRFDESEDFYKRALSMLRETLGEYHQTIAAISNNLAILYKARRDYDLAARLYRDTLEIYRQVFGENSSEFANTLTNYAVLNDARGNVEQAEAQFRQALEIYQSVKKPADSAWVIYWLAKLALNDRGRPSEALPLAQRALAIRRAIEPATSDTAASLVQVGRSVYGIGDPTAAVPYLGEALEIYLRLDRQTKVVSVALQLATWLVEIDDLDGAESSLLRTLPRVQPESTAVADLHLLLGEVKYLQASFDEAQQQYERASWIYSRNSETQPFSIARTKVRLAELLVSRGEPADGKKLLDQILESESGNVPLDPVLIADAEGVLGSCLAALGQTVEGERLLLQSYSMIRAESTPKRHALRRALRRLADFYEETSQAGKAAKYRRLMASN